jgi:hypothetical protein
MVPGGAPGERESQLRHLRSQLVQLLFGHVAPLLLPYLLLRRQALVELKILTQARDGGRGAAPLDLALGEGE